MKLKSQFKHLVSWVLAAGLACVIGLVAQTKHALAAAPTVTVDFKFDANNGANPTAAGASSVNLTPGSAGQTYLVDIWVTISNPSAETPANFGLQSIALRGASDITTATGAFSTGSGIGVVPGSFTELSPFNPAGFVQPAITDIGKTTNGGASVTSGADGITDFGGTITAQRLTISSSSGGPVYGTGSSNVSSFSYEVGTFQFQTGTATASGTTEFVPTLLTSGQGAASAGAYTAAGGAATTGAVSLSVNPLTFNVTAVSLGETADNTNTLNTFGPAKTVSVASSGTYSGISSTVVAVSGSGGSDARPNNTSTLGGQATILAGTNTVANGGGTATVSLSWRTRLSPSEVSPAQHPPIPVGVTTGLVSDVLNLSGMTTSGASHTTDPFVLDMSYNPALLPKGGPPAIENGLAHNKLIYMVSPSNSTDGGPYVNTVSLDTGNVVSDPLSNKYGYFGSYAAFQADANGGAGGTPASELGAWGIDTTAHEVWAVVNHNSEFAVVPEPSTFVLGGLGIVGLIVARRRNKNA